MPRKAAVAVKAVHDREKVELDRIIIEGFRGLCGRHEFIGVSLPPPKGDSGPWGLDSLQDAMRFVLVDPASCEVDVERDLLIAARRQRAYLVQVELRMRVNDVQHCFTRGLGPQRNEFLIERRRVGRDRYVGVLHRLGLIQ